MIIESVLSGIIEAIAGKAFERTALRLAAGKKFYSTAVSYEDLRTGLAHHIKLVAAWALDVSVRDSSRRMTITDCYVDLDLRIGYPDLRPRETQGTPQRISELVLKTESFILLGDPGAGKTTSLKRLALSIIRGLERHEVAPVPLLIRARDHVSELEALRATGSSAPLLTVLLRMLGVEVASPPAEVSSKEQVRLAHQATIQRVATTCLDSLRAVVIVDGLDELPPGAREAVVPDLRHLFLSASKYRVFLSSRGGEFPWRIEGAEVMTIQPLTDDQVYGFAEQWLGPTRAADFVTQVKRAPYAGSETRPLTLAHLCAIYERTGQVPDKPRSVYQRIIQLLLREWDEQNSVRRVSRYGGFDSYRKEDFLRAIAYQLTVRVRSSTFTHEQLEQAYLSVCENFGLPKQECLEVTREIESHTGLILRVAFERFEFAHRALQEFLAAEFMLTMPEIPEAALGLPNECAIAVTRAAESDVYFIALVRKLLGQCGEGFTTTFVHRLLLEKVDIRPSQSVGWAVLFLFAEAYHVGVSDGREQLVWQRAEAGSFRQFASVPQIRLAVSRALSHCSLDAHPSGLLAARPLWSPDGSMVNDLRRRLDSLYDGVMPVDCGVFDVPTDPIPS